MKTMETFDLNALMYLFKGEPGTRKSTQALSFPTPQYWFSHDKKMNALVKPMKMWGITPKDIQYDNYIDYAAMEAQMKKFRTSCPYKTLIVDSVTSTGDSVNNQTKELKSGTVKNSGEEAGMRVGGIEVNTMQDYKAEAAAFQEILSILTDVRDYFHINVILIAHIIGERKAEEKAQSTHFARIIVTGGKIISAKIPAYCEEIYHFNVDSAIDLAKEGDYGLVTSHTGDDYARTCLPLPKKIVFGGDRLYTKWIKPAIDDLTNQKPVQQLK